MKRLSPYARIWALVAIWMVGGLSGMAALAVVDQMALTVGFVLVLFVIVSVLSDRVRCSKCGEPVINRSQPGAKRPWTGVPIWPVCSKCGHSLKA